jgi:hypothetical protein
MLSSYKRSRRTREKCKLPFLLYTSSVVLELTILFYHPPPCYRLWSMAQVTPVIHHLFGLPALSRVHSRVLCKCSCRVSLLHVIVSASHSSGELKHIQSYMQCLHKVIPQKTELFHNCENLKSYTLFLLRLFFNPEEVNGAFL